MKVFIVHAHPEPKSFNGAMRDTAIDALQAAGHEVVVSDLYAMGFNPVGGREDLLTPPANPDFFKYQVEQRHAWDTAKLAGFAPEVAEEQRRLVWSDLTIFQFPLYWFNVPAIMKGWFDRVFACGFSYGGGAWFETAPLRGRKALLSFTMAAAEDRWGPAGLFGSMERILWQLHVGTLQFCGFDILREQVVYAPAPMTDEKRKEQLRQWSERLSRIHTEAPLPFTQASVPSRS